MKVPEKQNSYFMNMYCYAEKVELFFKYCYRFIQ